MPKLHHHCNARLENGDVPIAELNLDPIEFAFLTATRFFCLSFSEPTSSAWVTAMLSSSSFFPEPGSAEMMRRTLAVLHEMRTTRRSTFRFSNPRCEGCTGIVTHDERHLIQIVRAIRQNRKSTAFPSSMVLCEGYDTTRLHMAIEDFCKGFEVTKVPA